MLKPQDNTRSEMRVVPEPTLRRLTVYYQYLNKIGTAREDGFISCTEVADSLGLTSIQVRKDFEFTNVTGKPKVGYSIRALIEAIEHFLGWDNITDAFLIGAGHLGAALLGYQGFKDYGLNIVAAFDIDDTKVGKLIHGKKILPMKKLPEMIKRMNIKIGILTAPAEAAQDLADTMVAAGVKAVWNFAPVRINVRDGIIVQHENLASSLAVLSKRLATVLADKK